MSRRTWVGISVVVVVLALVWWFTFGTGQQTDRQSYLELGAVLPLTGDTASYGQAAQRGIDLAVETINAGGGVNGKMVKVVYEDTQGQATVAVSGFQKLITVNQVPLVFGAAASSISLALCPIANEEKVILFSPISSSQALTKEGGPFFFRVCPSDVVQAFMMAEWIQEEGHRTAGVIFVKNSWGEGLKNEFESRFQAIGGEVVAIEAVQEGVRDLRAQLTKVKAADPDALYAITYGREGGALLRQAKELAFTKPIYGADVWGSPELLETAGDAANGVQIVVPTKLEGSDYESFAAKFQSKYGEEPDTYAAYAYDMTIIAVDALRKAPSGEELRRALGATSHEGVTGLTRFDENGDVVGKGFQRKILP